jgi:hypothetical protein
MLLVLVMHLQSLRLTSPSCQAGASEAEHQQLPPILQACVHSCGVLMLVTQLVMLT